MDAYERIDDYELIEGVALTEAQEDYVAEKIRAALDEFKPLRLNKRKTRTLFNKKYHLWPSQKKEGQAAHHEEPSASDTVALNSLVFLYALYTVLESDQSFGHLHNMLATEITTRDTGLGWSMYSCDEASTDFYARFNPGDIKRDALQIEDPQARIAFLESLLKNLEKYDFSPFERQEKKYMYDSTESLIQSLIQEAESTQASAVESVVSPVEAECAALPSEEPLEVPEVVLSSDWSDDSELCYNPNILGLEHFHDLDLEIYPGYATSDDENHYYFQVWLFFTFNTCYSYSPKSGMMIPNHSKIGKACGSIKKLYDDYVARLEKSQREWTFLYKADCLAYWLRKTLEHIEKAYDRFDFIDGRQYVKPDETPPFISTEFLRNGLVSSAFAAFDAHRKRLYGEAPDRFRSVVHYNFWPDTYEEDFEKYYGKVGLTSENRAKVYLNPNRDHFKEQIKSICDNFISDFEMNPDSYPYLSDNVKESTSKMLQNLFYDYMLRIDPHIPSEDERANTGLDWIMETMHIMRTQLVDQIGPARMRPYMKEEVRDAYEYFYLDCCLMVLSKMLSAFIEDNSELHRDNFCYLPDNVFDDSNVGWAEHQWMDDEPDEECSSGEDDPVQDSGPSPEKEEAVEGEQVETHLPFGCYATMKKRPLIIEYLHKHIGYKPGVDELIYIAVLYKKGYISLPTPKQIVAEFPKYEGKKSTISSALSTTKGSLMVNVSDEKKKLMEEIKDDFELELKHYLVPDENNAS
jgi:hypothetical protein